VPLQVSRRGKAELHWFSSASRDQGPHSQNKILSVTGDRSRILFLFSLPPLSCAKQKKQKKKKKKKMATLQPEFDSTVRRRSISVVEINGPDGRRKTVDLSELNEADRQLAEQFGYKPVRTRPAVSSSQ
jgi:hypothetical protein